MPLHPALSFLRTAVKEALTDPENLISQLAPKCYECKRPTPIACAKCGEACCSRHVYVHLTSLESVCEACVQGPR